MIKEALLKLVGTYEVNQFSWLDVPWICSVLILCVVYWTSIQGLYFLARKNNVK